MKINIQKIVYFVACLSVIFNIVLLVRQENYIPVINSPELPVKVKVDNEETMVEVVNTVNDNVKKEVGKVEPLVYVSVVPSSEDKEDLKYREIKELAQKDVKVHPILEKLFTWGIVGADLAYVEKYTGVPRRTIEKFGVREYEIDGCVVNVYTDGKTVKSIALDTINSYCTFTLSNMGYYYDNIKYVHEMTFGMITYGEYYSSCFHGCGTAHEPSLYALEGGAFVNDFMQSQVALNGGEKFWDAVIQWFNYVENNLLQNVSEDDKNSMSYDEFTEAPEHRKKIKEIFYDIPINRIRFGFDIDKKESQNRYNSDHCRMEYCIKYRKE